MHTGICTADQEKLALFAMQLRCNQVREGTRFNQVVWKRTACNRLETTATFHENSVDEGATCGVELIRIPGLRIPGTAPTEYHMRFDDSLGTLRDRDYTTLRDFGRYMFDDKD